MLQAILLLMLSLPDKNYTDQLFVSFNLEVKGLQVGCLFFASFFLLIMQSFLVLHLPWIYLDNILFGTFNLGILPSIRLRLVNISYY